VDKQTLDRCEKRYRKLKRDYYDLDCKYRDTIGWVTKLSDQVKVCPKCDGAIFKVEHLLLHSSGHSCDLKDGVLVEIDVVDPDLQKMLQEEVNNAQDRFK